MEPEKVHEGEIRENLLLLLINRLNKNVNSDKVPMDVKIVPWTDKEMRDALKLMPKEAQGTVKRRMGKTNAVTLFAAAYLSTCPDSSVLLTDTKGWKKISRTDSPNKSPVFKIQSSEDIHS